MANHVQREVVRRDPLGEDVVDVLVAEPIPDNQ